MQASKLGYVHLNYVAELQRIYLLATTFRSNYRMANIYNEVNWRMGPYLCWKTEDVGLKIELGSSNVEIDCSHPVKMAIIIYIYQEWAIIFCRGPNKQSSGWGRPYKNWNILYLRVNLTLRCHFVIMRWNYW